ncbi:helix-turn-helix domain-containing protein [Methylopila sp. M107]|uniref:helix-turn-helix domain-containing protein n=1 Tax=Methylopila sp. M107 TaxID=1101190 RepID=UPI00036A86E6|nr:helix-turn-helix domain-containing protein [Methylopila sp. M107]
MSAGLIPYAGAERAKRDALPTRTARERRWPPERLAELKRLTELGFSATEAGRALGCSRNAVLGAIHRTKPHDAPRPRIANALLRSIIDHVGAAFDVSRAEMLSRRGDLRVSEARRLAIYLCRVRVGASTSQLAQLFGRTRGTICVATAEVENRLRAPIIRALVAKLDEAIALGPNTNFPTMIEQENSDD